MEKYIFSVSVRPHVSSTNTFLSIAAILFDNYDNEISHFFSRLSDDLIPENYHGLFGLKETHINCDVMYNDFVDFYNQCINFSKEKELLVVTYAFGAEVKLFHYLVDNGFLHSSKEPHISKLIDLLEILRKPDSLDLFAKKYNLIFEEFEGGENNPLWWAASTAKVFNSLVK